MDAFLPYFAGFFDGEGSIGIYGNGNKVRPGRTLRVQVTQRATPRSTDLLKKCQTRWGGSLSLMNRQHANQAWNWQASAGSGVRVLQDIRPWLYIKAAEADIALAYWEQRSAVTRGANGRWLALDEADRLLGEHAEAALKAAKRENARSDGELETALQIVEQLESEDGPL
ncbi:hypothetical protein ACI8AA_03970 [Geodermatophilus sp. SYSU D01180]